tara:strand:- start:311 stop:2056 length:1746 start_codon:yes stop_codon:yes gene_type:complete
MRVLFVLFLIGLLPVKILSQINLFSASYDSLRSDDRIEGTLNDLEISSRFFDAAFILSKSSSRFLSLNSLTPYGSKIHQFKAVNNNRIVSPLPHIGFSYIFGTQGAQKLGVEYQQVFQGDWVLNSAVSNIKSGGYFRNTAYGNTNLTFSLTKKNERYGFSLSGRTTKVSRQWSGGVIDSVLLESFAPLLVPVYKPNCNSTLKYFETEATGYIRLISNEKYSIGFLNVLGVNGENRVYTELDTLSGIYSTIYYDSLSTNDQYQRSAITNSSALYIKRENLSYSAGIGSRYWNYRNRDLYRDTFELDVIQQFELSKRKFQFSHQSSFNLIGAANTWVIRNDVKYRFKKAVMKWSSTFGQTLPELYQRFYSANNVFYSNVNQSLQSYTQNTLGINFTLKRLEFDLGYLLQTNNGVYFFDPLLLNWSNQTDLNSSVSQQAYLKTSYVFRKFHWYQSYRFTHSNIDRTIIPKHQLQGNFMTRLGLFKAKKLQMTFGLSYHLTSKTNIIPIIENIGVFDLLNVSSQNNQKPLFTMGAMLAMEIETFRFFVKLSNMGYLWNSTSWQYIDGIYLPEVAVRVGLTWDFWN